mgnify:CR=1 FL=1
MTDTDKLNAVIADRGIKKVHIAKALNITPATLSRKLGNKSEFMSSQIDAICKLLNIDEAARSDIFFAT